MVIIMLSKNSNGILTDFIQKPQKQSAPKLHQLFNNDSAPFQIPTARELIIEKLTWYKWFEKEHADFLNGAKISEDKESQELCKLINIDFEDLDISVIDEYLDNKQERCVAGKILSFKDFKLKNH